MISKSIYVGKESYTYLNRISREQRGCKPLSQEAEDRHWNRLTGHGAKSTWQLDDNSMGGGDGTYWGKWWSWSVETLKKMLDEAGLPYTEGPEVEYMNI